MMVYMGNIIKAHEELGKEDKILCKFGNGDEIGIYDDDEISKVNGDLQITRKGKQKVIIDTAFIKFIVISRRFI